MSVDPFKLSFEISPIVLTGGSASFIPGGMLPILSLVQSISFATGLLSGPDANFGLDQAIAHFRPLPGSTLIDQDIGNYPFANQAVAANAVIRNPLVLSMLMTITASQDAGYAVKLATMIALQNTLQQHNNSGGLYTVATPSFLYTNLVFRTMRDASDLNQKQPQNAWILDFVQPLVTLADAAAAQNSLMSKIGDGVPTDGSFSGVGSTVGDLPSLAVSSVAPAASNLTGSMIAKPAGTPA